MRIGRLAVSVLVLLAAPFEANAREDARTMTCDQAHDLVFKQGEVTLTTGPGTFMRFVRTRRMCQREEVARIGKTATSDDPECPVGYMCVPRIRND